MRDINQENWGVMHEVLQSDILDLKVESYSIREDLLEGTCSISLKATNDSDKTSLAVEGEGVGLVDAVFNGMKERLSGQFPSLKSLSVSSFEAQGLISFGPSANTDAEVRVTLGVRNSYGRDFNFGCQSRSIGHASIQATVNAIEYFVNSERTFVQLYKCRKYYESERRSDLVDKYTTLMTQIVNNTSYSEVIDEIKNEL